MPKPLYQIIDFPYSDTKNGVLYMFQSNRGKPKSVPFLMKRVLAIIGMRGKDARGAHTHHKTNQVLVAINGGCTVDLDDGKRKRSIELHTPNRGLVLYPYVWHVMRNFKSGTILLSLTDRKYSEKDYIRDYNKFLMYVKRGKRK